MQKNQNIQCPFCKEMTGQKSGIKATVSQGKKQRYKCRECGRSWY